MFDKSLVKRFDEYASAGGQLILTCRTGLMDRTGQLWNGPLGQPILPLIGAQIEAYDGLPDDAWGTVEMDATKHRWQVWGDLLHAEPDTKVLAKYADQFYAGAIAATQKEHGSGIVTYCGVYAEPSFVDALVEKIARQANIPVTVLPSRVHLIERDGLKILLNYQDAPVEAPAPVGVKFVIGSRRVEPAGVAVWQP
jgi:beta-galactosidase